ncbi:MAG: PASTA domain-containing protein, partial [Holophagales bacterium]|nr:PASTA domain-containing protein [Holophagales bacterium]
ASYLESVHDGGGTEAALNGVNASGKTGTGEIAEGGRGYIPGAYLASFGGYFPFEDPEVVVLCMLVKPQGEYYGGQVAAPLFATIGERLATELEVDRQGQRWVGADFAAVDAILTRSVSAAEPPRAQRIVPSLESALIMPDVRGMPLRDAVARLGRLGLVPVIHGSGVVQSQIPEAGEIVNDAPSLRCGGTGVAR